MFYLILHCRSGLCFSAPFQVIRVWLLQAEPDCGSYFKLCNQIGGVSLWLCSLYEGYSIRSGCNIGLGEDKVLTILLVGVGIEETGSV